MKPLVSLVPGFEGVCMPIWLNGNQVDLRLWGHYTGFFRLVDLRHWRRWKFIGKEFHGYIDSYDVVRSTEGMMGRIIEQGRN